MNAPFFNIIVDWINLTPEIKSAVLFGSAASQRALGNAASHPSSDLDLHLIARKAGSIERIDWNLVLPDQKFCFQACRPASGGVRKITTIFEAGQLDLIVVPLAMMRVVRIGMCLGLYNKSRYFRLALDEMATCLRSEYRFIKGESSWHALYSGVSALSGIRLSNRETRSLADVAICETLWVFQKLEKGELVAAQHVLHSKLSDINLRLWRELRLRRSLPLPSFGLGRQVETLAAEIERRYLCLSARLVVADLNIAAWKTLRGLKELMVQLDAGWSLPTSMESKFERYR